MRVLFTTTGSITGNILYSDTYVQRTIPSEGTAPVTLSKKPFLNRLAVIPILGSAVGVFRVALAVVHIVGHLFAALIFWDSGHLKHVAKGSAEFLRGSIEAIPFVGNIFVFWFDAQVPYFIESMEPQPFYAASVFLVKISHPNRRDHIDEYIDRINEKTAIDVPVTETDEAFQSSAKF